MSNIERRMTKAGGPRVEQRAEGGPAVVTGYAAVFYDAADPGTEYRLWNDLVERIMPTAFTRAMAEDDVRALFNHDPSKILGRNKAGTLALSVDQKGLRYEITLPDTATAREVAESIRRGDVSGSSFGFTPKATSYREVDGAFIIQRDDVNLFDVGPVTFPAYESTETGVRAAGEASAARSEVEEWVKSRRSGPCDAIQARARAVEIAMI